MVIDADALNILAAQSAGRSEFKAQAVLTPHPGEMKRLARLFDRERSSRRRRWPHRHRHRRGRTFGQIIVLKGHRTVVTDGARVYVNRTGDSTLSKAGTGDVLSGMIGR